MNQLAVDPTTLVYHELRGPLALIVTAARSAAEESVDELVRRRCQTIERAAERMLETARQVIDLARTAEFATVEMFSPAEALTQIVRDLGELDVAIRFVSSVEADRVLVRGARGQFEALVHSLLTNAIDHGDPDRPILLALEATADEVVLTIQNWRGTTKQHAGLGVGLYLCERMVAKLGGALEIESDDELHTATIVLPAA